jgi:flagellar FliL protein
MLLYTSPALVNRKPVMRRPFALAAIVLLSLFAGLANASAKKEEPAGGGTANEYLDVRPAIITNFGGPGPIHFLKADISLRLAKNPPEAQAKVAHHLPQIRHHLIMLFSRQTADSVMTMESKEQLRQQALAAIQKLIKVRHCSIKSG